MIKIRQDVFTPPPRSFSGMTRSRGVHSMKLVLLIMLLFSLQQLLGTIYLTADSAQGLQAAINDALANSWNTDEVIITLTQSITLEADPSNPNLDYGIKVGWGQSTLQKLEIAGSESVNPSISLIQNNSGDTPTAIIEITGTIASDKEMEINNLSFSYDGSYIDRKGIKVISGMEALFIRECEFSSIGYGINYNTNYHPSTIERLKNISLDLCSFSQFGYHTQKAISAYYGDSANIPVNISVANSNFYGRVQPADINTNSQKAIVDIINNNIDNSDYTGNETRYCSLGTSSGESRLRVENNVFKDTYISLHEFSGEIRNNKFISLLDAPGYYIILNADFSLSSQITIQGNEFYGTSYAAIKMHHFGNMTASIINNSFFSVGGVLDINSSTSYSSGSDIVPLFANNLISCTGTLFQFLGCTQLEPPISIRSSFFANAYPTIPIAFEIDTSSCDYGNPYISGPVSGTYSLRWDNDIRSPLIMNGYGSSGMGTPSRYDRLDIGAVQYDDQEHEYITYTFPPNSERNGLKWMSFPTLDRIWNPTTNEPDVAFNLFYEIMDIDTLDYIVWKVLDGDIQTIQYLLGNWMGENHIVVPQQGYKIQMDETATNTQYIRLPGIIPEVSQYPLTIKALPAAKNDPYNQYNENWLGYFHTETANAEDAFASVIDSLWYIQTQDWTMVREKVQPGSPWIYVLQKGKKPTLSYGDMVIVKCFSNDLFTWNTGADNQIPIEKELPIHYVYEEKADYVPFYVALDADDLPSEVALYVDDICKGATVVCDSLVEIPGYVLDGTDPNAEVEILAYYENKAAVNKIHAYRVWNPESGAYDNKPLKLSSKNNYYKLKLEKQGDGVPAISEPALSIYPNPFNPSTTIKFSLNEPADIKLEIYNQRGQLVKCLTQGKADSGFSSIIWNGTDSHNRKVASGLYYSKLSYNGKSIIKKMILLK